jgi:GWxTD domain-containing protein
MRKCHVGPSSGGVLLLIVITLLAAAVAAPAVAQDTPPQGEEQAAPAEEGSFDVPIAPNEPQRKPVLAFGRGPASLLLSPEEAVQFDLLTTRFQRKEFIDRFWKTMTRNCPPGVNQTRQLFWRRVEAANEQFDDEGVSGWRTDRGAIFVLLGGPESSHELTVDTPSGERRALIWVYPEQEGTPRTVAFLWDRLRWMFAGVDEAEVGPQGPSVDRLSLENIFPVIREYGQKLRARGCELTEEQRQEMLRTQWLTTLWEAAGKVLAGEPPEIAEEITPQLFFFPAQDDATFTQVTVRLPEPLADGERLVASMRAKQGDEVNRVFGTETAPFQTRELADGAVLAQAARTLRPGPYGLVVGILDSENELRLIHADQQLVARVPTDQLRLSSVVLARELSPAEAGAGEGPFRVGGFEVVPRLDPVISHGDSFRIFYQVLGAQEAEDGSVDLQVSYQVSGKAPSGWQKIGAPVRSEASGAALAWELPIVPRFPPTQYKVEIRVVDRATGRSVSREVPFEVRKQ